MSSHQRSGLWAFMRRREALFTSPADGGSHQALSGSALAQSLHMPEPEVPHDWDPMAGWLPQTPALPAAPGAAPTTVHTAAPGTAASSSSKAKAGGFWGRLKRRLTRSGRKGRGGSSSDGGELLAGGGAASPPPPLPSVLHTTGSMPLPPGLAAPGPAAFQATWHSRIPRPPLPGPSAGSSNGSRPASAAPAAPQGTTSSTPGGSSSRLLEMQFSHMAAASGGGSSVAPSAQQQQAQQPSRYPLPGNGGSTARRLVFSPAAAGAGAPGAEPYPTQPIPIAPAQRQQPGGGHVRRLSWQQDGHPAQPGHYAGAQQAQQQAYQQRGAMQQPAQGPASLPAAGSLPGFGAGSLPGFDAGQVQQLLGAPARSGLAGRWVREAPPRGSGGGGAGGEGEAGDSAAEVDFLLQIPPLQAAARERTRELQIRESSGELGLEWGVQLSNGSLIRRAEVFPKSGALAAVPRLDGRAGTAAAQLFFAIDGSCTIKALQAGPLPALIHQKLRLSANGDWLRIGLKVQLLEGEGPGGGGSSRGGGASAKQATYWRRVHA